MLERLTLRNFQRHRKLVVDFDPRVTTIVGPTDAGKSAIIRGLLWVLFNRPSGQAFIRHGTDRTRATLRVDGHRVRRTKAKKDNAYELDGAEFKAFSQGVPDPVRLLLNVEETNVQAQHDSPFWFALSPGAVSKELNRIVNLQVIDGALADTATRVRRARSVVEVSTDRLQTARQRRRELKWVQNMDRDLRVLEDMQDLIQHHRKRLDGLRSCLERFEVARKEHRRLLRICEGASVQLARLRELATTHKALQRHHDNLSGLVADFKDTRTEACRLQQQADELRKELNQRLGPRCPLCGAKRTTASESSQSS